VYGVHQILAHSSQVRIDDYVDDTSAAADLIEVVEAQFGHFTNKLGHLSLLHPVRLFVDRVSRTVGRTAKVAGTSKEVTEKADDAPGADRFEVGIRQHVDFLVRNLAF
jgi:hypothetical protein